MLALQEPNVDSEPAKIELASSKQGGQEHGQEGPHKILNPMKAYLKAPLSRRNLEWNEGLL